MAAATFDVPKLKPYPVIPLVAEGAMAHSKPFVASPAIQQAIGFPGELAEGWEQRALAKMGELLDKYRSLRVYMDACVHCGACSDKCHYYLGTGDPKNMPVARQDLMRSVYRRYFTFAGKHFPKLVGATDLTKDVLDQWWSYYNQCSECRRCSVFCPYGIDTAEVTMAAREIMDSVGLGQKYANEIIGKVHRIGNNLGIPEPALADTLEGLEEDTKEETGLDVRFPLDVEGAEVLLITPSADFFSEPHVESLIGYAKVFGGTSGSVEVAASDPVQVMVQKNGSDKLIARIVYNGPVRAPIEPGQPIGVVKVWRGKEVAVETPIHATQAIGVGSTMRRAMDGALELVIGAVRSGAARL